MTLTGADGALLAEIADDRVTASRVPATGEPLRWREVEVEVPSESPELQQAVADRLFAAGARPAGHGSKLATAAERLTSASAAAAGNLRGNPDLIHTLRTAGLAIL